MQQSKDKKCIEEVIGNAFKAVQDAYIYQTEKVPDLDNPQRQQLSRIVFPKKRDETTRISEQELRFVFVEQLNKKIIEGGWNVFYSIETPTFDGYSGFTEGKTPRQNDNGRSGEFDLVIFNEKLQRIALIEFKANNASGHDHKKDFVKLNNNKEGDDRVFRYLIEIVGSLNKSTLSNLHGKIEGNKPTEFRCWSLEKGKDITKDICTAPIKENP